ncbi:CarD family transcriptional regulator [Ornithinimicrobium sufpigmenti]|uniref:CarD family transcriptional regulator n=1 Tax=Ornithinimicrobium sufpigmenti TaxID=2508882 RepID=UPI0015E185B8|nr:MULTISPECIES: CarD family transcriptional regulator [unclassified Ornithinimicrobium]
MQFSKGQILIHPQHGPATVTKVTSRTIQGERRRYLILNVHTDDMSVAVPVEAAEEIGVRAVIDAARIREVFAELADEGEPFDKVWSRRFKHNTERLRSGDLLKVAGLIRDVTRRDDEVKVSYGEANLLREALDLLTAELAIALRVTTERAVELVESAVRERAVPELGADLALAS